MQRVVLLILVCSFPVLWGCAATERASDEKLVESGFLEGYYSRMRPGDDGEGLHVYRNLRALDIIRKSDAILLEPVQLWLPEDSALTAAQAQAIAGRFYATLSAALAEDYRIIDAPEPGALRFEVALTAAEGADVARDVISKAVAPARVLSTAASKITGKPMFQGSAAIEAKISDAMTGEVLVASMDRRVGGNAINAATLKTWGDVYEIMDFWTAAIRYKLCSARGDAVCIEP